jgi:hypothetical protein
LPKCGSTEKVLPCPSTSIIPRSIIMGWHGAV